jgi:hypothetical protein
MILKHFKPDHVVLVIPGPSHTMHGVSHLDKRVEAGCWLECAGKLLLYYKVWAWLVESRVASWIALGRVRRRLTLEAGSGMMEGLGPYELILPRPSLGGGAILSCLLMNRFRPEEARYKSTASLPTILETPARQTIWPRRTSPRTRPSLPLSTGASAR